MNQSYGPAKLEQLVKYWVWHLKLAQLKCTDGLTLSRASPGFYVSAVQVY